MFTLSDKRQVLWPVTINEPSDDGSGTLVPKGIRIRYILLDRDEMAAAIREAAEEATETTKIMSETAIAANDKWLADRIVGWADIADQNGELVDFDAQKLAALIRIPYAKKALDAGLWEASRGAPAKN